MSNLLTVIICVACGAFCLWCSDKIYTRTKANLIPFLLVLMALADFLLGAINLSIFLKSG